MKKLILRQCLESLRQIQTLKHDELDPGVKNELAKIADGLEFLLETESDDDHVVLDQSTVDRTLTVIGRIAVALDWVCGFFD